MIIAAINESLTNVTFNLDKSLERLARIIFGLEFPVSNTITGANELAVLLSDLLGNMQMAAMSMPGQGRGKGQGQGKGKGQGEDFNFDIIKTEKFERTNARGHVGRARQQWRRW